MLHRTPKFERDFITYTRLIDIIGIEISWHSNIYRLVTDWLKFVSQVVDSI